MNKPRIRVRNNDAQTEGMKGFQVLQPVKFGYYRAHVWKDEILQADSIVDAILSAAKNRLQKGQRANYSTLLEGVRLSA